MRRSFRRWARGLSAALGLLLLGAVYESASEAADARAHRPPGRLIDVGGHRLHLYCVGPVGRGGPTVVIDAGLGDWSTSWTGVQSRAARTTRVCAYDRAGMGYSEPGAGPRTAERFAGELHTLLQRANIAGPYVLVGHSMGGLTVRVFAGRYPGEVAGVVLVESMGPLPAGDGPAAPPPAAAHAPAVSLARLAARVGLVRLLAGPLGLADGLPPSVAGAYVARLSAPRHFETVEEEAAGLPESLRQAGAVTTLGDLPLVVLSRGRDRNPEWEARQVRLLRLSSAGRRLVAEHSGHLVELDEPDAAVRAILAVVRERRP